MRLSFIMCVMCLAVTSASAQESRPPRDSYVVARAQDVFVAVAAQPDCPLRIEEAQMLMPVDKGRAYYQYKLTNKGDKPIHYFTVVAWNAEGTGGTLGGPPPWDGKVTDRLLQPGESVRVGQDEDPIVPFNSAVQEKWKLNGKLKTVVILLVDHITFADGSEYDFRAASKSLIDFFAERAP